MSKFPLFPEAASTMAGQVDLLYTFLVSLSLVLSVGIAATLIMFAVRYRRRADGQVGDKVKSSTALELTWSLIPLGVSMFIFAWAAQIYVAMARPPDDAHEIFVVGKQWMWKLQHLEGRREINELHVPVGQPIKLTMTSEDVIHSFYVPAFRVKADVVPGRYNTLWFEATEVGSYHLFCAEYCGTEHSQMIGSVHVMEQADFQAWLSGGSSVAAMAATVEEDGAALFQSLGCATCHKDAPGAFGPSLVGIYGEEVRFADGTSQVVDDSYLRESILDPTTRLVAGYQPLMPTFRGQVDEEKLLRLVQYIKSLSEEGAVADAAGH